MRRLCSAEEKQIISRNLPCFFTGSLEITKGNSKKASIIAGVLGAVVGMILYIGLMVTLEIENTSSYMAVIFVFAVMAGAEAIAHQICKKHAVKTGNKGFVEEGIQSVNGGTIVGINQKDKLFYYIEDDIFNFDGLPIVIDYPANESDLAGARLGERVLIVYHQDNSFQLMHANQETIRLIPACDPRYPLTLEPSRYKHVPHPNAINMNMVPKQFDEADLERFEGAWRESIGSNTRKPMLICIIIFTLFFLLIGVLIGITEESLAWGLACGGGFAVFLDIIFALSIVACTSGVKKRVRKVTELKEAIFCNTRVTYQNYVSSVFIAYEWENGSFHEKEYILSNRDITRCKYGDIIYLLFNKKGNCIMAFPKSKIENNRI